MAAATASVGSTAGNNAFKVSFFRASPKKFMGSHEAGQGEADGCQKCQHHGCSRCVELLSMICSANISTAVADAIRTVLFPVFAMIMLNMRTDIRYTVSGT